MEKIINVFARHEIKYILSEDQRRCVMRGIKDHMIPDPHGMSTIRNIYYDTPDYRLIRKSLDKPIYKEKIRLRSYGRPTEDTVVFLELKKKYDGVVHKRRVEIKEKDAESYMSGAIGLSELEERIAVISNPQIAREIDYFKNYYGNLKPIVYLSYDRCAYFSDEDESLRITFDKNIKWRGENVRLTEEVGGEDLLKEGESLMEIKTATALPVWLTKVLSEAGARPASFSKYGNAYRAIIDAVNERKGKENDKYICEHILERNTDDRGICNQPSRGAHSGGGNSDSVFLPYGALKRVSHNSVVASGDSRSNHYDG